MKPSPLRYESSEDDEQSEEDPIEEKVCESEPSQDEDEEYDENWDSSGPENLEDLHLRTINITPARQVKPPGIEVKNPVVDEKPIDNKSQDPETLVMMNFKVLDTPRKVPLFKYPPGYDKSSTGTPKSGFTNVPGPSQSTPSKDPQPGPTIHKLSDFMPSQTGRTYASAMLKHFANQSRLGLFEMPKNRRSREEEAEDTGDRIQDYSKPTDSKLDTKTMAETSPDPSEQQPRKRDNSWSEDSEDEGALEDSKILTKSGKRAAEEEEEVPEKLAPAEEAEPSKPLPTQPWYAEIEKNMKALVLQAAGGAKKPKKVERIESTSPVLKVSKEKELEKKEELELEPEPEETVDPEHLARLVDQELSANVFSPFYNTKAHEKKPRKKEKEEKLPRPSTYKHSQAIRFAAKSHLWKDIWDRDLPDLPVTSHRIIKLPQREPPIRQVFAFYRVLAEKQRKYILIACNVNVHGFHRGDLRFLEVNFKTKLQGFEESVMGNLFLGDILAVTQLARNSESRFANNNPPGGFQVSSVNQDSKCYWMVSKAILYPRSIAQSITCSFVKNRKAVVKGDDEPMTANVEDWDTVNVDSIYTGSAFRPIKLEDTFSQGFMKSCKQQVVLKALRIATYPNAFGTIFHYEACPEQNEEFLIGTKAFSGDLHLDAKKREKVVETCSLMGFSAANTIFNGRFDCRAFYMQGIRKMGLTVDFRIENPPGNPTLGLWNAGNRIRFGGPLGDVNAVIETVIECDGRLKIVARMSRDCPKNMSFDEGDFFVSQREISDPCFLYDGYFQLMADGSNGKRIIQTLYGGKALEIVKDPNDPPVQYFFPSIPDRLPLNQYQNEYVQMLLDGNPLVIGSSPFGCGKSMTIITAALEIYKRNCKRDVLKNQSHQLLITQSNFASVNLIEITKRICASKDGSLNKLKFARYVSEKNWNELSEHCRTDHDMPHLMKEVFKEWAIGGIPESDRRLQRLSTLHQKQMMGFLLKNTVCSPEDFNGPALRVYEKNPEPPKMVQSNIVTEAFFLLYQPDIIMTTADSSKNLIGLLKEVCTVQIDEASQLPEYTLLGLLKTFSSANFGLIGDIHQLPPYCEETLDGKLKEFGIGNTMERAIEGKLFPISTLRYVYRCHPKTTQLLSELFYEGRLISGITEDQRDGFMRSRADFWPNANFPMMILNHTGASFKMGTSTGNHSEKELVGCLVQNLLHSKQHRLKPSDIGVISFYSAQTSILTEHLRPSRVKCGTVDAFQGTEKEVIIVCCTNSTISGFMQDKNRLNVALSRAKQATIIVGNLDQLAQAKYWSTIVKRVEAYGNLRQANDRNLFNSQKPYCSPSTPHKPRDFALVKNPYYMGNSNDHRSQPSPSPTPGPSYGMVPNPYYMGNQQQQRDHYGRERYQEPEHRQEPHRPHRGHRNHRPSPKSRLRQDDVMRGQWNTTTHSFRRDDGYQHP